jgi:hypothetical protein
MQTHQIGIRLLSIAARLLERYASPDMLVPVTAHVAKPYHIGDRIAWNLCPMPAVSDMSEHYRVIGDGSFEHTRKNPYVRVLVLEGLQQLLEVELWIRV